MANDSDGVVLLVSIVLTGVMVGLGSNLWLGIGTSLVLWFLVGIAYVNRRPF